MSKSNPRVNYFCIFLLYYVVLWKISYCGGELARQRFYGNQCNRFSNLYATLLVVRKRERERKSDKWTRKKKVQNMDKNLMECFLFFYIGNTAAIFLHWITYLIDLIYYFYDHINCSSDVEIVFFRSLLVQVIEKKPFFHYSI